MTKVMVRLYFSTRQKNVLDEAGEETTWEETCSFYAAQRKCWKSILGNIRGAKKRKVSMGNACRGRLWMEVD